MEAINDESPIVIFFNTNLFTWLDLLDYRLPHSISHLMDLQELIALACVARPEVHKDPRSARTGIYYHTIIQIRVLRIRGFDVLVFLDVALIVALRIIGLGYWTGFIDVDGGEDDEYDQEGQARSLPPQVRQAETDVPKCREWYETWTPVKQSHRVTFIQILIYRMLIYVTILPLSMYV